MRRIGLNKMSICVNVRATGKICIEKRLVYRLTHPPLSGWDVIPKFLSKQTITVEIVLFSTDCEPVDIRAAS